MDGATLKKTLKDGGHVFGCMLAAMSSTRFAAMFKGSTLDFAIIDNEHAARDRAENQLLCTMLRQAEIAPVIRVPIPKAEWVAMALDAGASGILVPYCETVEEVEAVVAAVKWHPLKGEYLKRAVRENILPSDASREYLEQNQKHRFIIIGIESEPAYERLDDLLAVGGIDGVFIGPHDMSTSLGIPNDYTNPRYTSVVKDIIDRCEAVGVPVLVHQMTLETSKQAIELGSRFVLHSMEAIILQRAMQSEFSQLREAAVQVATASRNTVDVV